MAEEFADSRITGGKIAMSAHQDEVYAMLIQERAEELTAEQADQIGRLGAEVERLAGLLEQHDINPDPQPSRYTVRDLIRDLLDHDLDAQIDMEGCDCFGTCGRVERDEAGWVSLRRKGY